MPDGRRDRPAGGAVSASLFVHACACILVGLRISHVPATMPDYASTRSLDDTFGLDQEAIKAVSRWRFEPGRRLGKAVPVRVGVEMSFMLR